MICNECGAQNPEGAAFCKNCGSRLPVAPKAPTQRMSVPRIPSNREKAPSGYQASPARAFEAFGNTKASSAPPRRAPAGRQPGRGQRKPPLFTTRNTGKGYLIPRLLSDILGNSILAVSCFVKGAELYSTYWYRSKGNALHVLGVLLVASGILSAVYHIMVYRTYADVFADRIVGSGMQGIQCKEFILRIDQINDISISRGFLNIEAGGGKYGVFLVINSVAGKYRIMTTEARAREILEQFS